MVTADQFRQVEEVFHKAKVLDPADRASFLDEACGDALDLRAEVESLLAHSDQPTSQMHIRPDEEDGQITIVDRGRLSEGPGTRIGPYKILQQIGEGGFGVVYMAEQEEPVQRKVALKIIKLGMDTKQVIARFEAERQALALMNHPNIAKVLEAGATETGRPYFVMELVKGITITEYCDRHNLSTRQRLDLFIQVCSAIQHAHQKGVIHRDIKPSNVLVTLHDTRPVPMVIDFGIAKATSRRLTEKTLFTEFRQFIGTPEYMSPDQAEISGLDVDTRTDIYSLGVLLYELLTGTTPFDSATMRKAAYGEIQRILREVDPPKPSTRLDTMADHGADTAKNHRSEPGALSRLIRGDLDWIVMKAIEKDRTRRYQSASEFASDVQRYLDRQPVLAGPPNVIYKLRKFVLRHQLGVVAGILITAAMLFGLTSATIGLFEARQEAQHSREVSDFLQQMTMQFERGAGGADDVSVDEIVQRGRALFSNDHAVIGTLLMTRASTLNTAGRLDEALQAHREALAYYRSAYDGDHPAVASALSALAGWLKDNREYHEGEDVAREALQMKQSLYGNEHKLTADALGTLTEMLLESSGSDRREEIKQLWGQTLAAYEVALGREDRKTVGQRAYFAKWLHDNGYYEESYPLLKESVDLVRRVRTDDDLTLFFVLNSLARHHLIIEQDYRRTAELVEELIETGRKLWGFPNDVLASVTVQLIMMWNEADDSDAAGEVLRTYLAERRASSWRPSLASAMFQSSTLGVLETWLDDHPDVGRELALLVVDDMRHAPNAPNDHFYDVVEDGASWLAEHGFDAEAEPIFAELLTLLREEAAPDPKKLGYVLVMLGGRKVRLGQPEEAEPLLRECLEIRSEFLPAGSWLIASVKSVLGESLCDQSRFEEAEPLLIAGYEGMIGALEIPEVRPRNALQRVIKLYDAWGKPEKAAQWRQRSPQPAYIGPGAG